MTLAEVLSYLRECCKNAGVNVSEPELVPRREDQLEAVRRRLSWAQVSDPAGRSFDMNLKADSPLKVLHDWYEKLPPDVRTDVSWQAYTYAPGLFPSLGEGKYGAAEVAAFRTMLNREPSAPMDAAGKAVIVAALVDFIVVKRTTTEQWKGVSDLLKDAAEFAKERRNESMQAQAAKWGAEIPFKGGMWVREVEDWKELRSGPLSPAAVYEWMLAELHSSSP